VGVGWYWWERRAGTCIIGANGGVGRGRGWLSPAEEGMARGTFSWVGGGGRRYYRLRSRALELVNCGYFLGKFFLVLLYFFSIMACTFVGRIV
jgi:hypothetical protein